MWGTPVPELKEELTHWALCHSSSDDTKGYARRWQWGAGRESGKVSCNSQVKCGGGKGRPHVEFLWGASTSLASPENAVSVFLLDKDNDVTNCALPLFIPWLHLSPVPRLRLNQSKKARPLGLQVCSVFSLPSILMLNCFLDSFTFKSTSSRMYL